MYFVRKRLACIEVIMMLSTLMHFSPANVLQVLSFLEDWCRSFSHCSCNNKQATIIVKHLIVPYVLIFLHRQ